MLRCSTAITATPPGRCRSATIRHLRTRFARCGIPCIAYIRRIATDARWDCGGRPATSSVLQQLEQLLAERGDKIAAVIVEPLLQAAGGMIVHPVEFLQKVRAACDAHEVLLIADEVLTGFGRTGKMFACDLAGVVPDLMCLSKAITGGFLPMGVTLCSDRVESAFRSENRLHTFYHGHSYTGNALACAAANASLQIFDDEPVFDRIAGIARIHGERLAE